MARVVIGVLDPTSRGAGGAALLRDAGVKVDVGVLGDEALVVLGTWLEALERGRPRVICVYREDAGGGGEFPAGVLAGLRSTVDVVVLEGFTATEGVPGAHGDFTVPRLRTDDGPLAALEALYDGGARSVLVNGGRPLVEAFLAAGLVDEVLGDTTTDEMLDMRGPAHLPRNPWYGLGAGGYCRATADCPADEVELFGHPGRGAGSTNLLVHHRDSGITIAVNTNVDVGTDGANLVELAQGALDALGIEAGRQAS